MALGPKLHESNSSHHILDIAKILGDSHEKGHRTMGVVPATIINRVTGFNNISSIRLLEFLHHPVTLFSVTRFSKFYHKNKISLNPVTLLALYLSHVS